MHFRIHCYGLLAGFYDSIFNPHFSGFVRLYTTIQACLRVIYDRMNRCITLVFDWNSDYDYA